MMNRKNILIKKKTAYRSHLNGISKWIIATKANPDLWFDSDGEINLEIFTPGDFEESRHV